MNKTREQIINSMCMTWQHDYGLLEDHKKNIMFSRMAQIFDHDIKSELMMQSDIDNYEEEIEENNNMIESLNKKIKQLELENKTLKLLKYTGAIE